MNFRDWCASNERFDDLVTQFQARSAAIRGEQPVDPFEGFHIRRFQARSTAIASEDDALKSRVMDLEKLVGKLIQRIDELEKECASIHANVDMLKGLSELEADIEAFKPP